MTASAPAVWMCPDCGHGSADPRDERAHLDAHRQLRAFFEEWETGTEEPVTGGPRRSRWLVRLAVVAIALVMLLVSSSMYSRINSGEPEPGQGQAAPADVRPVDSTGAPAVTSPPASTPVAMTPPPAAVTPPPDAATSTPATAPQVNASPKATAVVPAATSPALSPAAAPTTTVPTTSPPAVDTTPAPAPPAHLLSLCLPGICLNVL